METVFIKVAAFVVIICAGYFAGSTGKLEPNTAQNISKIVFNFTLPCAVINAFGQAEFDRMLLWFIPVGIAFTVIPYFVMFALTRKTDPTDRIFYLCNICGYNIGCFALPFVQAFFPAGEAVAIALFDAGNSLMMSGGTYALTSVLAPAGGEKPDHPLRLVLRRLFSSVTFCSYLLLIALALFGIRIPEAVIQFTQPMANANGFLALFMLGLMTKLSFDREKLGKVIRLLIPRYLFAIVFTVLTLTVLPFTGNMRTILIMGIWAPVGSMGPVFTMWCKGDQGLAGFANAITVIVAVVAMTTIVSLI